MPFCPKCGYEYTEGAKTCPDCNARLVASLPEEKYWNEEMVPVYSAGDEYEADIIRALLEEAGVPTIQRADVVDWPGPFTVGPLAEEEIAVPASRVDEAKQVIDKALEEGKHLPE